MTKLHMIDADLPRATGLADLLARRRFSVTRDTLGEDGKGAVTMICGAATDVAMGGTRGLVEAAKALGATRIVSVADGDAFTVTEDLGGRLLRVTLPAGPADPLRDGALMALVDLIASPLSDMAAADPATGALIDMAARVARFDVSVFINGPTGSGKEVLARQIHARSPRAAKPFVAINCAAIPENMLEAILFGHEKGSFTGAQAANVGILRAADGGTLLLDEISEMPLGLQAKLLRVLQERVVTPLGSTKEVAVDIRVIATSNRDMELEVREGRFREDLLYRLNVFPLDTMALADRPQDIPVLAQSLLRRHAITGTALPLLSPETCDLLADHAWPGNVRELENVMQRAIVLAEGGRIGPEHIMLSARRSTAVLAARLAA
ncbi:sigma-54 interaction domain-containing protein [Roseicyclus mahoneyensis]|uniref:Nif-specific regulatory protein n=1 Tax=Roseicyclus mahoneyensis TaxID=164332 RepID=A0A316GHR8_9RHOB|nr:sigma-54 dependent transcriptional regulator [Roseicyclus mahoneyensis]PWK60390.1 two-component system response regulator FlrC [Roseicyclus mahoneyensis]